MSNPILSIIVPVYNVEKYIVKCITSIINQNEFEKTELIIVNDGTQDNSVGLITPIIDGISNVILINQKNAGLSEARNSGLKVAKGEYVWFVDSDDSITSQSISLLLKKIESSNDCYGINLLWVDEVDGSEKENGIWQELSSPISGIAFMQKMKHLTPIQRYIVKRNLLIDNNLYFYPGILHEDLEYVPRLLYYVKTVDVVKEPVYNYLRRTGSISASIGERNLVGLCKGVVSIDEFTDNNVDKEYRRIYHGKEYEMFQHFIHKYSEYIADNNDLSFLYNHLVDFRPVLKNIKDSLSFKDKMHINFFLLFPSLYVRYRRSRIK